MKLPKRIAGVKIPKTVRKGPIGNFLNSSAGQLMLAEALVFAAGIFAAKRTDPNSRTGELLRHPVQGLKRAGRSTAAANSSTREAMTRNSARLSFAFGEAARAFRDALNDIADAGSSTGLQMGTEPGKKKSSSISRRDALATPH